MYYTGDSSIGFGVPSNEQNYSYIMNCDKVLYGALRHLPGFQMFQKGIKHKALSESFGQSEGE